jgi:hypothetical protein
MDPVEAFERPQEVATALELGDWPAVLTPDRSRPAERSLERTDMREHAALRTVARSMELQFYGEVHGASEHLWQEPPGSPRQAP